MSAPCAAAVAVRPVARLVDDAGRHRKLMAARPTRLHRATDAVATLGSLVTLSALLVLAGAVGGLIDGVPAGHDAPTVTATFDGAGR